MKCNNCLYEFERTRENERKCPNCGVRPDANGDTMTRHALEQESKYDMSIHPKLTNN